jgi:hypothetical protein
MLKLTPFSLPAIISLYDYRAYFQQADIFASLPTASLGLTCFTNPFSSSDRVFSIFQPRYIYKDGY